MKATPLKRLQSFINLRRNNNNNEDDDNSNANVNLLRRNEGWFVPRPGGGTNDFVASVRTGRYSDDRDYRRQDRRLEMYPFPNAPDAIHVRSDLDVVIR